MMITASTSMKLPNVSWPIDSENDRGVGEFGGNSEVMVSRPGSNRAAIYDVFRAVGNMLKATATDKFRRRRPSAAPRPSPAQCRIGTGPSAGELLASTSVGGDAGLLDDLGPQRDVGLDDVGELPAAARSSASQPATSSFCWTSDCRQRRLQRLADPLHDGCGVPVGTTTPNHGVTWASAKPCSAMVGTSGKYFERPSLIAPMIRMAPVCTCASAWLADRKVDLIRPLAISGTICG